MHEVKINFANRKRELSLSFKENLKLYTAPLQLYLPTILEVWYLVGLKKAVAH